MQFPKNSSRLKLFKKAPDAIHKRLRERFLAAGRTTLKSWLRHARGIKDAIKVFVGQLRLLAGNLAHRLPRLVSKLGESGGGIVADDWCQRRADRQAALDHLGSLRRRLDALDALLGKVARDRC